MISLDESFNIHPLFLNTLFSTAVKNCKDDSLKCQPFVCVRKDLNSLNLETSIDLTLLSVVPLFVKEAKLISQSTTLNSTLLTYYYKI